MCNNDSIISRPEESIVCQKVMEEHLNSLNIILNNYLKGEGFSTNLTDLSSEPLFNETFKLISQVLNKVDESLIVNPFDAEEDNFENIFNFTASKISDALFILDPSEVVVYYNNNSRKYFKISKDEIRGKKFFEIVNIKSSSSLKKFESIKEIFNEKKNGEVSFIFSPITINKGDELNVTIEGGSLYRNKKKEGFIVIIKNMEVTFSEDILRSHKLESIAHLAGGIGHSFNNILTGIITNLFMARMGLPKDSDTIKLITEAEKAAFKATRLTKQLLTFSLEGTAVKERCSLSQLIQDSVGFCVSGTNVDYKLDLPEDLPMVEVDRGQIDQVLTNLTMNAVEAMPNGGTITISAKKVIFPDVKQESFNIDKSEKLPLPNGEYVKVSISDEGIGIPKKSFHKIFDPYFSTKKEGIGLGLTIAYSIIKKHGGHIEFESREGEGSTFSFYLPLVYLQKIEEKKTEIIDNIQPSSSANILLMDDDVIIKTVVEKLLKKAGYNIKCVSNGEECIEVYGEALNKEQPFKIVIMDLTIAGGGLGGKETVKKIKEMDNNAKVIVFSGYSTDPIFLNYKEYGFDGVLKKPFTTDELMDLIKRLI